MRLFQDYSRIDRVYPLSVVSNGLLAGPLSHDDAAEAVLRAEVARLGGRVVS